MAKGKIQLGDWVKITNIGNAYPSVGSDSALHFPASKFDNIKEEGERLRIDYLPYFKEGGVYWAYGMETYGGQNRWLLEDKKNNAIVINEKGLELVDEEPQFKNGDTVTYSKGSEKAIGKIIDVFITKNKYTYEVQPLGSGKIFLWEEKYLTQQLEDDVEVKTDGLVNAFFEKNKEKLKRIFEKNPKTHKKLIESLDKLAEYEECTTKKPSNEESIQEAKSRLMESILNLK